MSRGSGSDRRESRPGISRGRRDCGHTRVLKSRRNGGVTMGHHPCTMSALGERFGYGTGDESREQAEPDPENVENTGWKNEHVENTGSGYECN